MAEPARPKLKLKATADLKASQSNVVKQAKLMDSAGTAWHAVKYGNLEVITKLFPSQCNVYAKGPVGENVLHIAMLLNTPSTLAIAKYLVKLYGKTLVNTPYQERKHEDDPPGQYEGETALHIAIVNRDSDMVKFLVQNGADVRARAYGSFFKQGGTVYYGEYPLSFAACTGQQDIVSYLKRHGAHVNNDRDTWHNTALHMCVYHDQIDMYDHLVGFCGASENVRNNRGQTPLLLAASLGKVEIFQHIYNKRRKVAWAYGPVTSYSLSLHEIDTVVNSKGIPEPSAMEIMVRKNHITILTDPLVKTLVTTKWERFARLHFTVQATFHLAFVVLQTFLGWLHSSSTQWNQASVTAVEVVCIFMASLLLFLEVWDIYQWAVRVYHRRRFIKANEAVKHPLYAIPGEMAGAPTKEKTHFFNRILGGLSAHPSGAMGEGMERPGARPASAEGMVRDNVVATLAAARARAEAAVAELWRPGKGSGDEVAIDVQALSVGAGEGSWAEGASAAVGLEDDFGRVTGQDGVHGEARGVGEDGAPEGSCREPTSCVDCGEPSSSATLVAAWHVAVAKGCHHMAHDPHSSGLGLGERSQRWEAAAAVCEGQEEEGASGTGSVPRTSGGRPSRQQSLRGQQVQPGTAGASPQPAGSPTLSPTPTLASTSGGGAAGTQAPMAASPTSPITVPRQAMPDLAAARTATAGPTPMISRSSTTLPAAEQVANPATASVGASLAALPWPLPSMPPHKSTGPLPIDIVSVGLPPSSTGLASFLEPPRPQAVTSMLQQKGGTHVGLDTETEVTDTVSLDHTAEGRRRRNEPSLAGSVGEITIREGSEVASEAGEFRNRRRGGGGEDIKTLRPSNTKRRQPMPLSRVDSGIPGTDSLHGGSSPIGMLTVLRHALAGYYRRQLHDPIRLVILFHLIITFVHFITWASSYGGIGGDGPTFVQVQEFDDIVLSMVMLTGWCSMLYFARGFRETGQLQVMMEMCLWDLMLFAAFFVLADVGFTLAFYTLINGTTSVVGGATERPSNDEFDVPRPFHNIGYGMVQVLRFLYGEAPYDTYTATPSHVKKAFATMYFVAYVFMVVLLLANLFVAMIVHKVQRCFDQAEMVWRLRWTSYVLRTECRMTTAMAQRFRLGEVSYDPQLKMKVYNHVFEVVDDVAAEDRSTEAQIRALEATLDRLKKGGKKL